MEPLGTGFQVQLAGFGLPCSLPSLSFLCPSKDFSLSGPSSTEMIEATVPSEPSLSEEAPKASRAS